MGLASEVNNMVMLEMETGIVAHVPIEGCIDDLGSFVFSLFHVTATSKWD